MSRKYRMSSIQKRIYALDMMQGDNTAYNVPTLIRFEGFMDLHRLKKSFDQLIKKHEILRTFFSSDDEKFYQNVVDDLQIDIQLVSVMDMDQNSIMNLSSTYIMPFNLTELPLMRIYVFRTKFEDYMLLDIHHIICDGISLGILFTELSEAYSGQELSNGKYQYKNYSSWQNKKDFSEHRKFWEKEYQTLVEPTKLLPYMEMGNSGKGDLCKIQLKIDTSKLEKICHNLRTTEFMVLFSAFLGFISMQNQENKVAVGTPFNGRNLPGMDNLIGMFVNTLPIICEVDAKMTFEELVERVTEKFWQVYRYQDYPMEEIFSNVNLKMPCKNLFNIVFTYQIIDFEKINFQDLSMEILPINTSDSKFDLSSINEQVRDFA